MNVEQDGSLSFGFTDLREEFRDDVPDQVQFQHFSFDANVAAAYALEMKHHVRFARPGKLQDVEGLPYPRLARIEDATKKEQEFCLDDREEADLVLQHMGWASAWAHIIMCAEILFDTKVVDYELSVDPDCGHSVRSTFVIRPHINPDDWTFDERRNRSDMLHRFIRLANNEIYMMTCVTVIYTGEEEPPEQEQE